MIASRPLTRWMVTAGAAVLALSIPTRSAIVAAQSSDVIARVVFGGRPVPGAVVVATRGPAASRHVV